MSSNELQLTTANHIKSIFEPVLVTLDDQVRRVEESQVNLREELGVLLTSLQDLKATCEEDHFIAVLEEKSKKLEKLRRKLTLAHTLLQNSNERCRKLLLAHPITN